MHQIIAARFDGTFGAASLTAQTLIGSSNGWNEADDFHEGRWAYCRENS
jgi:hypothetical protein